MGSLSWPVLAFGVSDLWYGVCLLVPVVVFPLSAWLLLGAVSLLRVHLTVWWGVARPSGPAPAAVIPEPSRVPCPVMVPVPVGEGNCLSPPTLQLLISLRAVNRSHNRLRAHLLQLSEAAAETLPRDPSADTPAQQQLRTRLAVARVHADAVAWEG